MDVWIMLQSKMIILLVSISTPLYCLKIKLKLVFERIPKHENTKE